MHLFFDFVFLFAWVINIVMNVYCAVVLSIGQVNVTGNWTCEFEVTPPGSAVLAPPTFYLLFVVHQDIPSEGIWIKIQ